MVFRDIYRSSNEESTPTKESPVYLIKITEASKPMLEAIMEEKINADTYKQLHYVFPGGGQKPYIITQRAAADIKATEEMNPIAIHGWKN